MSRDSVQVELRDSTSISPDCSAVKRSLAESGENFTLVASLKIAAAIARQRSTSRPVQLPRSSGLEKPGKPWPTPQTSTPRFFTVSRVCAEAAPVKASMAAAASNETMRFMTPFPTMFWSTGCAGWIMRPSMHAACHHPCLPYEGNGGNRTQAPLDRRRTLARPNLAHLRTIASRGQGVDRRTE